MPMLRSRTTIRDAFYSNAPRTFPSSIVNFTHLKKRWYCKKHFIYHPPQKSRGCHYRIFLKVTCFVVILPPREYEYVWLCVKFVNLELWASALLLSLCSCCKTSSFFLNRDFEIGGKKQTIILSSLQQDFSFLRNLLTFSNKEKETFPIGPPHPHVV